MATTTAATSATVSAPVLNDDIWNLVIETVPASSDKAVPEHKPTTEDSKRQAVQGRARAIALFSSVDTARNMHGLTISGPIELVVVSNNPAPNDSFADFQRGRDEIWKISENPISKAYARKSEAERIAAQVSVYPRISRSFYHLHENFANSKKNTDVGCAITSRAIHNALRSGDDIDRILQKASNIEADLVKLSAEPSLSASWTDDLLKSLVSRVSKAKKKEGPVLHALRIRMDLKHLSAAKGYLSEIRGSLEHGDTVFELHLTHAGNLSVMPDFANYPELSSIDMRYSNLERAPDFTQNPNLAIVIMRRCSGPRAAAGAVNGAGALTDITPVFSEKPKRGLYVDLSGTFAQHERLEALRKLLGPENVVVHF